LTSIANIPRDFYEFLQLLNAHCVDYVIVGGYAVARHGYPRFTGDLDVLVLPSQPNAEKIMTVLDAFGFSFDNLSAQDFLQPGMIVQLGIAPGRIDLITSIEGVSNEDVFSTKVTDQWEDLAVFIIGLEQLIRNKRAAGRPQDIADAAMLEKRRQA
jgi:hypothetical protein